MIDATFTWLEMYFITTISLKFVPISESRDDDGIFRKPPSLVGRSLVYHAFSDVYIIREINRSKSFRVKTTASNIIYLSKYYTNLFWRPI